MIASGLFRGKLSSINMAQMRFGPNLYFQYLFYQLCFRCPTIYLMDSNDNRKYLQLYRINIILYYAKTQFDSNANHPRTSVFP